MHPLGSEIIVKVAYDARECHARSLQLGTFARHVAASFKSRQGVLLKRLGILFAGFYGTGGRLQVPATAVRLAVQSSAL